MYIIMLKHSRNATDMLQKKKRNAFVYVIISFLNSRFKETLLKRA